MSLVSRGGQESKSHLVLESGVRSILEEDTNKGDVATVDRQVEWSQILLVPLVYERAMLQQHLGHPKGAHLHGEKLRRDSIVPHLVSVRTVLEEDLGDIWEPLPRGLEWRGS